MENHELDKLFRKNIGATKIRVDAEEIWQEVKPRKKKRRFFFFWLLAGCLLSSSLGYFYFANSFSSTEPISDTTGEQPQNQLLSISTTPSASTENESAPPQVSEPSTIIPSTQSQNPIINQAIATPFQSANGATRSKSATAIPKVNPKSNTEKRSYLLDPKAIDLPDSEKTTAKPAAKGTMPNLTNHLAIKRQLEILLPLDLIQPVLEYSDNMPLLWQNFEPLALEDSKEQKAKSKALEIGSYAAYGKYRPDLSGDPTSAVVSQRENTETNRFSFYSGVHLTYWFYKNLGASVNFEYQRHYAYFQDSIVSLDYQVNQFQHSYLRHTRSIKSNLILHQMHFSCLLDYKVNYRAFNLIISAGPSYNVSTKGVGKFYSQVDELTDLKEDQQIFQSSAFGIMTRLRLQYSWNQKVFLNAGIHQHFQRGRGYILDSSAMKQRINASYFSLGLSHLF